MKSEIITKLNAGLDLLEKSTKRAINVASVPTVQQAYEAELLLIQEARVVINQKDFFKS